jgi:hypothetical protein
MQFFIQSVIIFGQVPGVQILVTDQSYLERQSSCNLKFSVEDDENSKTPEQQDNEFHFIIFQMSKRQLDIQEQSFIRQEIGV